MFRPAISIGISISEYWDLTLGEILTYIEIYNAKEKDKAKELLATNYNLSYNIAVMMASVLGGSEFPSLEDLYPEQFPPQQTNWQFMKDQMLAWAEEANRWRHK